MLPVHTSGVLTVHLKLEVLLLCVVAVHVAPM